MSKKRVDKSDKMKVGSKIIGLIHRIIEVVTRVILLIAAYITGPAESQPPITDLIHTLRSTKTIAIMIREKRVSYNFVGLFFFVVLTITDNVWHW